MVIPFTKLSTQKLFVLTSKIDQLFNGVGINRKVIDKGIKKRNMEKLINTIRNSQSKNIPLPFSVYSSIKEQNLLNVPVIKPLLIAVLSGHKKLGDNGTTRCSTGDFVFLSNTSAINMHNIPKQQPYFALIIEFEFQDFENMRTTISPQQDFCLGEITFTLKKCLQQFIEWSTYAPQALWPLRRKEIIELMCHMGHKEILAMVNNATIAHQIHTLFSVQLENLEPLTVANICQQLAMSESTLRRKLKDEKTTIQEIKDQTRLGLALHLLQTTHSSIGLIAERCGYQSQSRFTDRFKTLFGLTPSELRKTKMED